MITTKKTPYQTLKPLQITWKEKNQQIVFVPEDEDRFVLTAEAAIKACRNAVETPIKCKQQFDGLVKRLARWIKDNQKCVDKAFLNVRETGFLFLVVQKDVPYDLDLESSLTSLDIEVARSSDFDQFSLDVISLPKVSPGAITSFLTDNSLVYKHA
ncbi:MAG: hypothetical protein KAV18_03410 [Candidatus Omnitrophica bacterium]|nr:hypothetical protein [Candidatus Omnitrophota bacterium]